MAFCENSVRWLYVLDQHFTWESSLEIKEDVAFKDKTGVVRLVLEKGGRITVMRGYAWNGCSPKYCLFDILLGTPEGVVDSRTRRPKTFYASLVHDALYQFVPDGLPRPAGRPISVSCSFWRRRVSARGFSTTLRCACSARWCVEPQGTFARPWAQRSCLNRRSPSERAVLRPEA